MANKMLIDAAHPEETRVVVLRGNRVEEFDFESANRRQLRGNIYLAKVTRVEPSLQAAFVDYGGNRHGFLAFSEIHPDYYQIPVADRQALIAEEERAHRAAEAEHENRTERSRRRGRSADRHSGSRRSAPVEARPDDDDLSDSALAEAQADEAAAEKALFSHGDDGQQVEHPDLPLTESSAQEESADRTPLQAEAPADEHVQSDHAVAEPSDSGAPHEPTTEQEAAHVADDGTSVASDEAREGDSNGEAITEEIEEQEVVESVGGADALEEVADRQPRMRRQYKIQEVIKRRQIMLVQVVKEERGSKGAALTTYLSLAGRYSVLMPNTARGGGISRKITSAQDRARLKEVAGELEVPEGMGVILRTAGASRTPTEIRRDFEYLLRVWETVRDLTLKSTAPTLVYEEGSLVKRAIRDLYNKDIEEVIVGGEAAYREAKDFVRMLMPGHGKNVRLYRETTPMFSRFGIESQLDAMFSPVVTLRSGGYIVLNQAEALVAIDVNSGRATREHHIEDTALKTNLEAAEEVARQLRLRDLAGLIVIDFIDMDENRNNRAVERRLKDALKNDRARIQVGRISHFGLMEMSRQRIRTSVLESSTDKCPHCGGTGHVRSVASLSLQLLRVIEETLLRGATHDLIVRTNSEVALYILNHKRAHLRDLEQRFRITITVSADATLAGQQPFIVEKGEQVHSPEQARAIAAEPFGEPMPEEPEDEEDVEPEAPLPEGELAEPEAAGESDEAGGAEEPRDGVRRRRRRRRRGGGGRHDEQPTAAAEEREPGEALLNGDSEEPRPLAETGDASGEQIEAADLGDAETGTGDAPRRRRRGRRGGRRNRRGHEDRAGNGQERHGRERDDQDAPEQTTAEEIVERVPGQHRQVEPEIARAVSDFGGPQSELPRSEPSEAPAAAQGESPRKRSTVRERVSFDLGGDSEPAPRSASEPAAAHTPSPAPAEPAGADKDQPRRTGWWAKKLLGN
jgi:ribonuclease E